MNPQPLFKKYNFHPKKRWGQNFLIDENIKRKIIKAADLQKGDTIVEIGPGFGVLTEDFLKQTKRVIAIEKDKRLAEVLKDRFADFPNLEIINDDILKVGFRSIRSLAHRVNPVGSKSPQAIVPPTAGTSNRIKVISNLPYYTTTPIIFHLFEQREIIDFILITVQKEVGERLVAQANSKDYGILSVKARFFSESRIVFNISAKSFFPAPNVHSCLVRLDIYKKERHSVQDQAAFFKIIEAAFSQRRKTILNCLADGFCLDKDLIKKVLKEANIDFKRRGETFSLEEFISLYRLGLVTRSTRSNSPAVMNNQTSRYTLAGTGKIQTNSNNQ